MICYMYCGSKAIKKFDKKQQNVLVLISQLGMVEKMEEIVRAVRMPYNARTKAEHSGMEYAESRPGRRRRRRRGAVC